MSVLTYRAAYRLEIGESFREPGELVPEAVTWFRVESYLHTGRITAVEIELPEFIEAVATYCPADAAQIYELSGLPADVILEGPHRRVRKVAGASPDELTAAFEKAGADGVSAAEEYEQLMQPPPAKKAAVKKLKTGATTKPSE